MNMTRIIALATRIMRQVLRDRRTLALMFIVPFVVMALLYFVLTSTSSTPTLALVLPTGVGSDRVNTLIATMLPTSKVKVLHIQANQVESTLKGGDADAAVVFPADFVQQIMQGQKPAVQIVLEGSNPTVASAMRDLTQGFTQQLSFVLSTVQQAPGQGQPLVPAGGSGASSFTVQEPRYLYGGAEYTFNDSIAPVFIGIFSFFFVYLLTSIAFLRERLQGTIERIMVSPLKRTEVVMGYVCGFTLFALLQSLLILLFIVFVLRVHYSGNLALVFLITALLTIGSVNLGIFLSAFARNEFQVVQFIPLVLGIQVFLSGVFWPIAQLPQFLQPISYVLPLTYANEALRGVMLKGNTFSDIAQSLTALLLFAVLMVLLSAFTMRREVA